MGAAVVRAVLCCALHAAAAAPAWLPASLRELEPIAVEGAWEALLRFFEPGGGGSETFRIALDATRAPPPRLILSRKEGHSGEA